MTESSAPFAFSMCDNRLSSRPAPAHAIVQYIRQHTVLRIHLNPWTPAATPAGTT